MKYSDLLRYKQEILSLFDAYGVENPRVFGSTVHGTAKENSDVDFLVEWSARHSLFDRIGLMQDLKELLNTKVDLVTEKTLYPSIRQKILDTAIPL